MPEDEIYTFPQNTGDPGYRAKLEQWQREGTCPFCTEREDGTMKHFSLKETADWWLKRNSRTMTGVDGKPVDVALLIIRKDHTTKPSQMRPHIDWPQIGELMNWATLEFNLDAGCALMTRMGGALSGKTVAHDHIHIIKPRTREDGSSVEYLFSIGDGKEGA